jgi:hypothetical protein
MEQCVFMGQTGHNEIYIVTKIWSDLLQHPPQRSSFQYILII